MAWIYLIIAGVLETVWAVLLKRTEGFTKLGPSVITLLTMAVSFYLLSVALKTLPTGTGYAIKFKDDYARAGIPMLPVAYGVEFTQLHILLYTIILFIVTLLPYLTGMSGLIFASASRDEWPSSPARCPPALAPARPGPARARAPSARCAGRRTW